MVLMGEGGEGAPETWLSLQGLCTGQAAGGAAPSGCSWREHRGPGEGEAGYGLGGRGSEESKDGGGDGT